MAPDARGFPGSACTCPGGQLGPDPWLVGFKFFLLSGSLNSTSTQLGDKCCLDPHAVSAIAALGPGSPSSKDVVPGLEQL